MKCCCTLQPDIHSPPGFERLSRVFHITWPFAQTTRAPNSEISPVKVKETGIGLGLHSEFKLPVLLPD